MFRIGYPQITIFGKATSKAHLSFWILFNHMEARSGKITSFSCLSVIHFDSQQKLFLSVVSIKSIKNEFYLYP